MVGADILDEAVEWASARFQRGKVQRLDEDEHAEGTVTFVKGSLYSLPFSNRSLDGCDECTQMFATRERLHACILLSFVQEDK